MEEIGMEENYHKLLIRQIRKNEVDLGGLNGKLMTDISKAYYSYEEKIKLLENIIEVSQKELLKVNGELRRVTLEQELEIENKIIELRQTNKHLEETKKQMLTIIGSIEEAILSTDLSGVINFASPNFSIVFGFPIKNLVGRDITSFCAEMGISSSVFTDLNLFFFTEVEINRTKAFFSISQNKDYREKGHIVYTFRNITIEKETAKFLKKQKEFSESILENMPADIVLFSRDHRYLYLNSKAIKDPERRALIIGKNDKEYAEATGKNPQFAEVRKAYFQESVKSKKIVEFDDKVKTPDGRTKVIHRLFIPFLKPEFQEDYVMGFGIDITELNETQEKLKENERRLRLVLESSHDAIFAISDTEQVIFSNPSCKQLFGWDSEEIIGKSFKKLLIPEGDESLPSLIDGLTQDFSKQFFELRLKTKQGQPLAIELSVICVKIESNQTIFICFARNVTEQKNAEREIKELNNTLELKVQERTRELQIANKEMELFSYSVSHDLKSPLRAIAGFANILDEDQKSNLDEQGQHFLNEVIRNANRMSHLIDSLLSFSRLGKKEVRKIEFDLQELVTSVIEDLKPFANPITSIKVETLGKAIADPDLIRQVFINLIGNAVKYSSKKESPEIHITSEANPKEIAITIKDNGAGFNMDYYDKLFGVFQRLHTDKEFEGTGVGLALTQKIIIKHGGRIWANSEQNIGSSFIFTLPNNAIHE
jgi:PAS domain S-box-containing protein